MNIIYKAYKMEYDEKVVKRRMYSVYKILVVK